MAGWHDPDLVAMCVVQILLGGGDSFSAGGPGKGMYSRLYRELLNRYYWVEGAEAFVNLHNETGVLGIAGAWVWCSVGVPAVKQPINTDHTTNHP